MKRTLDEGTVKSIYQTLLERFGEPIVDQGLSLDDVELSKGNKDPDPNDPLVMKDAMGRVVGKWSGEVEPANKRRIVKKIGESENGGRHPGHAASCTCPDCSRSPADELEEKSPPGREKQVKALKKDKNVDNPWATAWASYNKR